MKFNYKNSKSIGIVIGIVLFIALIGGITYAVFNWRSTNTNISVNTKCFDIEGNSSYTVNGSNMLFFDENDIIDTTNNTITYKNGMIYYPFNITRGSQCNTDVYYEIIVNVTQLSEDYRNGALKYKIIDDMSSYTSEKIANPINEDLAFRTFIDDSILGTGVKTIYAKNVNLNTNIIPAVVFYLDGDLVPEDAHNLTLAATIEVVASQGETDFGTAAWYVKKLYDSSAKSTATVNNITYNLAPSVNLMNDRLASMSIDINGGDIRYYGANPNNYVWLGDTYISEYTFTSKGSSITRNVGDKKLWRIVGAFDGRLKLISDDPISNIRLSWDSSEYSVNGGYGINQWGESTYSDTGESYPGADLMRLLNPGYESYSVNNSLYWNKGIGNVYVTSISSYNFTNNNVSFSNTGLSSAEKSMIDTATWYLGAYSASLVNPYVNVQYFAERQSSTLGKGCSSGVYCTDTVTRTGTWNGNVGLIYASDIGYATDLITCSQSLGNYSVCNLDNWLSSFKKQWTLSPFSISNSNQASAIIVFQETGVVGYSMVSSYNGYAVHPAIYLKSGVTISSGAGSESDPYILSYSE